MIAETITKPSYVSSSNLLDQLARMSGSNWNLQCFYCWSQRMLVLLEIKGDIYIYTRCYRMGGDDSTCENKSKKRNNIFWFEALFTRKSSLNVVTCPYVVWSFSFTPSHSLSSVILIFCLRSYDYWLLLLLDCLYQSFCNNISLQQSWIRWHGESVRSL